MNADFWERNDYNKRAFLNHAKTVRKGQVKVIYTLNSQ